jgi:tetratricopeptide (TPR) repeat protein
MSEGSLLRSAQQAQQQGRYADSEKLYLQLLSAGFQPEAMLNALAKVCFQAQSFTRAKDYLLQLCTKFPNEIAYCEALATLYAKTQDWTAAAECYARFVDHNSAHADAYYNYAYNLKQAAQYQGAIDNYQASLDHHVSQPEEVLTNMAVIYSEHLRLESKAIESLELALQAAPNYIPAMFNLATLYEEQNNKEQAAKYYQAILKLDANNHSALVRLADARPVSDSSAPIIRQLQQALTDPNIDDSARISLSFALGKLFDDCAEYDRAFNYYVSGNRLDRATSAAYSRAEQEQQVDDNIAFFTEQWFADLTPVSDAKPIFICGMFRSGSTLIEQILASHSSVTAGGERDFFLTLGSNAIRPYPSGIDSLAPNSLLAMANQYLLDLAKAFPQAALITDKRPDNFLYLGLIKALFPAARIIHSKRQRLDNCLSVYFLRAGASVKYASDLGDIAHYYQQYLRLMAHWQSLFVDHIHEVNYDNLVADPEPAVRALLDFLELPWEPECLAFHALDNRVKTASIWQVRQPLYQKSSGRWKNYQASIKELMAP